jgi:hypothetical protein
MLQSEWHGCYDDGWKGMIVDEAFSHPAKMAYGLLTRIVRRMVDEGWVEAGQVVGDPFGGIGTGGIVSAYYGLHWVGVELEPRFVELAGKNFDLHRPRWENLPGCVAPRIVNGDSRRFAGLVGEAAAVVTSPPYAEAIKNEQNDSDVLSAKEARGEIDQASFRSPGPYSQCRQKRSYGTTPGQIGALKEGTLAGVVTSPPYEGTNVIDLPRGTEGNASGGIGTQFRMGNRPQGAAKGSAGGYGETDGQIGYTNGDTYWQAMHAVYGQMHLAMKPGAVAAIVVKDYVKAGKRVPLCDDTCTLLAHLGFDVFERTRAMLVKRDEHPSLFDGGEAVVKTTQRKSFFRRLAESKGSPPIDWEEVIWARKAVDRSPPDAH